MILIAMDKLCDGAIDFHLHLAVRADRIGALQHQLGRAHAILLPPRRRGTDTTPTAPTGIPRSLRIKPPVTLAIQPIPWRLREPAVLEKVPLHLNFYASLRDRSAMVVVCGNGGLESFTERDGFGGSIDLHLVFRLFIFLHAKHETASRNLP